MPSYGTGTFTAVFTYDRHWSLSWARSIQSILPHPTPRLQDNTSLIIISLQKKKGTRWRSWLRHCATNRKVASSIPDYIIGNSLTSFRLHYGLGVDSASNRNEYQEHYLGGKGGWCVGLTLPPSCAECLETWESQPPGTLRVCPGL